MYTPVEKQEREIWDKYFSEALCDKGQESENNKLWWVISENDTVDLIYNIFKDRPISILEAGCGSGGTNFSLAPRINIKHIDLMDISKNALKYAEKITPPDFKDKTNYINSSVMNYDSKMQNKYDLVWNTGLVEHYSEKDIITIISHMLEYTKQGGATVVGIPNANSLSIRKAAFLGTKFAKKYLPFIKGYRNTTEVLYSNKQIVHLINDNFDNINIELKFAGSPCFVGTNEKIVRFINRQFGPNKFSFLTYFIITQKDIPCRK